LTGKYSHINGFYNNSNSRFDGSQPTFPKMLQKAGYQTAMIGKWHLVSDPTGFDEWHILPGQGVYYNPPMIHNGKRIKHEGYTTDLITDFSLDWLKARDKSRPFLLMCQQKAPHRDWQPPLRHLQDGDRVYPEPSTLFDNYDGRGKAEHDQDMTIAATMTPGDLKLTPPNDLNPDQRKAWAFRSKNLQGPDLVRWKYQRYMHDYLGCVKAVDDSVGRLLKYLDDEGLADNTIVVYSSDQGFYLGEHGWFDKRWIFEESLKTPLLVRWPGVTRAGTSTAKIVSNVDFAQTFLEAAGLPIPPDMQGRSLVPLLKGEDPANWRKSFYYEYYEYPQPHHVRPHYGVVTDRYKLVRFHGSDVEEWELFDLKTDPQELRNAINDPANQQVVVDLKRELERLRADLKVPNQPPAGASGESPRTPAKQKK
jgi:arylsulfatase A-like enzyme